MIKMPIPVDEQARLADLRRLDVLLSEPEKSLDLVARELARIFDVPAAMMSFIDQDTQHYKAAVGLPEPYATTRTEPRELSVCSHVVANNEMLVVEDLLADDRFRDNPIVAQTGARFYAGAPLRADTGRAVGSLCIVDVRPRNFTAREMALLRLIADGAMAQVKLQVASRQLLQRSKQIERDLDQAMHVQRFLLPPASVHGEGWRISHLYRPVEHLGGDFLDLYKRGDGRWAILVADVSGHGASAALTAAMTKTAFLRAAVNVDSPAQLLGTIHYELAGMAPPGQFMTALAAFFDPQERQLVIASAGHPHPLLIGAAGAATVHLQNDLIMLLDTQPTYEHQTTMTLSPGDRLLIYTDGAVEAADPHGQMLESAGLSRYALAAAQSHPDAFLEDLFARINQHSAGRLSDDVALLCVEALE